jgi:hypothetical protein
MLKESPFSASHAPAWSSQNLTAPSALTRGIAHRCPLPLTTWLPAGSTHLSPRRLLASDDIERAAVAAEGYDPDDPALVAALARVSAVLADFWGSNSVYATTPSSQC